MIVETSILHLSENVVTVGLPISYTLIKIFKGEDFQSHIFRNILGKILPDCLYM